VILVVAVIVLLQQPTPHPALPTWWLSLLALAAVISGATDGYPSALGAGLVATAFIAWQLVTRSTLGPLDLAATTALSSAGVMAAGLVAASVRRRLNEAIAQLLAERVELQQTLRSKTEFMNAAAHELRTPLAVIIGYVSMLEEGSLGDPPPSWQQPLRVLTRKVAELGRLVDQMLMSARLEAGTLASAPVTLDLREVVQDALARAEPRAALSDATMACELPARAVQVEADPDHVGRILDNLINNALSYGGPRPWVKATVNGGQQAEVLVEDHGVGVPEEMRERIFERFVRVDGKGQPLVPGTGLGLAISRELAERCGGSLELGASQLGRGSRFVLRLPRSDRRV
jgi:signal transduction histidine kinase